jgi:hypothetical protein
VQEYANGGGYGEDYAAGGPRIAGGENGEGGDTFAAQGFNGLCLRGYGVVGGAIIGLDVD